MRISFVLILLVVILTGAVLFISAMDLESGKVVYYSRPNLSFWNFQSIDTMKYSRDLGREKIRDPKFDAVIDEQVKNIAATGATHVAIATPYDVEFLPMLQRWVDAARSYNLKVWFRGNWSGWEKWFGYEAITPAEHIQKTNDFILSHPYLFEDGDVFSGCPECENGAAGDPRATGEVGAYRKFLIDEYRTTRMAFQEINKQVASNYFSMNADVARLVMDKKTTRALGGIVTIDHYVGSPEKLASDAADIAAKSGGKIVLGEFGAPVPDINGGMSEIQQAEWMRETLEALTAVKSVIGVNYWVNIGGSTQIWDGQGRELPAVKEIIRFYKPGAAYGVIRDELNRPISGAKIAYRGVVSSSRRDGYFELPYAGSGGAELQVSAPGFRDRKASAETDQGQLEIIMTKEKKDARFKIVEFLKKLMESRKNK